MSYRLRDNRYPEKGKERPIKEPTALHKRIFEWLDPYYKFKYLDIRWLTYFEPGTSENPLFRQTYLSQEAGLLYQAPNFYIDRHDEQHYNVNKYRRPSVYNLDDKGAKHLPYEYREAYHRSRSYGHEFMVDMGFGAPLYAAVKEDPAFSLIDTYELLNEHPHVPETTKRSEKPFNYSVDNESVKLDWRPQVLKRTKGNRTEAICIPGIQMECVTKGVYTKNPEASSVGKHLRHAVKLQEEGHFEKKFGFDRVVQPFIFTSKKGIQAATSQMNRALQYLRKELKKPNNRNILFKVMPYMPTADDYAKPSSDFFLSPWMTASGEYVTFDDRLFFE